MNTRTGSRLGAAAALAIAAGAAAAQSQPDEAAARARVEAAQAAVDAAQAELDTANAELAAAQEVAEEFEPEPGFFEGWEGSVEAGVNGSTGNSENFNFRLGLNAERLTDSMETRFDALYRYATADGTESENRFTAGVRNDWLFEDSPWRLFVQGRYEYDEFQDWDHRISGFVGVGYEFIDNDTTQLVGRAGIGGNQTIGGADEEFTPEALLGIDLDHKLTDDQSIGAGTEVLLGLDPVGDYRVNSYAEYKVTVNPENNMFLKAGVMHRWDSDPGGTAKRSDLDYYLTLGWGF